MRTGNLGMFAENGAKVGDVPTQGSEDAVASEARYTIDELAAATGVPSRTIRFYQASGALPPPKREGRLAYYDDQHVERLRLVAELQDRGLSLKAIRDLVERMDRGDVSVAEWLGLGDELRAPWSDDRPRVISEQELAEQLGSPARPGLIADLVRAGLLERQAAGSYVVTSPALLALALKVDAAGVDFGDAVSSVAILQKRLRRAADEIVEHFERRYRHEGDARDVARTIEALRSVGGEAVRVVFAREIERALNHLLKSGKVVPRRRRRP